MRGLVRGLVQNMCLVAHEWNLSMYFMVCGFSLRADIWVLSQWPFRWKCRHIRYIHPQLMSSSDWLGLNEYTQFISVCFDVDIFIPFLRCHLLYTGLKNVIIMPGNMLEVQRWRFSLHLVTSLFTLIWLSTISEHNLPAQVNVSLSDMDCWRVSHYLRSFGWCRPGLLRCHCKAFT